MFSFCKLYFLLIILIVCILYVGYVGHTYIVHKDFLDTGFWVKDCICANILIYTSVEHQCH